MDSKSFLYRVKHRVTTRNEKKVAVAMESVAPAMTPSRIIGKKSAPTNQRRKFPNPTIGLSRSLSRRPEASAAAWSEEFDDDEAFEELCTDSFLSLPHGPRLITMIP